MSFPRQWTPALGFTSDGVGGGGGVCHRWGQGELAKSSASFRWPWAHWLNCWDPRTPAAEWVAHSQHPLALGLQEKRKEVRQGWRAEWDSSETLQTFSQGRVALANIRERTTGRSFQNTESQRQDWRARRFLETEKLEMVVKVVKRRELYRV